MMNDVIKVINQLQFVFQTTGYEEIKLPQIVVVGSQSCGKSSVLEGFVGHPFLPRGKGLVTRCPIVLQLNNLQEKEGDLEEWFVFPSDADKTKYTDANEVQKKIQKLTDAKAGTNKGISPDPIIVEIYSTKVVSLTLVDLPGIVKNPVGDQPKNIETQIKEIINKYIGNENAIILAVGEANVDMANWESFKMAKKVDPKYDRTLGVITKLDLMDKGTNATGILNGETINLKLGIVGVVNRSQEDIDKNLPIEEQRAKEQNFLERHYPSKKEEIGSEYLALVLNELLVKHIKSTLPALMTRINHLNDDYYEKLKQLGPEIKADNPKLNWMICQNVNEFVKNFDFQIKSRIQFDSKVDKKDKSFLGAEIAIIFQKLEETVTIQCQKIQHLDLNALVKSIRATVNPEGLISIEDIFRKHAKGYIQKMSLASEKCASDVHDLLKNYIKPCLTDKRLTRLNNEIEIQVRNIFVLQLRDTKEKINEYIKIQSRMLFSNSAKYKALLVSLAFPLLNDENNNGLEPKCVQNLIQTYVEIIREQVCDYVPKHIMHYLYHTSMEKLASEIPTAVEGKEKELMQEDDKIVLKRKEFEKMLKTLNDALNVIHTIGYN